MATSAATGRISAAMGARRVCSVCCQAVAAYTCPRCHKAYCSSACYKRHGQRCTESFYRDQATAQLKATREDASQQQHMMRILQRLHEQGADAQLEDVKSSCSGDSSDEDEAAALAAAGCDPDLARSAEFQQLLQRAAAEGDAFEIDPSQLSAELAAKLEALFISGRMNHLVSQWQPWWHTEAAAQLMLGPTGQRGVVELTPQQQASSSAAATAAAAAAAAASTSADAAALGSKAHAPDVTALPQPPDEPLPSVAQLAGPKFTASPLLHWQLLQLLVAYCAVLRKWNGEPDCRSSSTEQGWEAAEQLLLLAPPLTQLMSLPTPAASSSKSGQTAALHNNQQQQQQSELAQVMPDSVRVARAQLADAASRLDRQHSSYLDAAVGDATSQFIAGAVPSDVIAWLATAAADALALLRLRRPAVLLALTDCWRLLEQSRQQLKLQRSAKQKGKQQQTQQQVQKTPPETARHHSAGHSSSSSNALQQQQQLQQHLKLAARKLYFFMVWCNEQPAALHSQLADTLTVELQEDYAISQLLHTEVTLGIQKLQKPAAVARSGHEPTGKATSSSNAVLEQLEQQQWQHGTQQHGTVQDAVQRQRAQQQQQHVGAARAVLQQGQQTSTQQLLQQQQQQQQQGMLEQGDTLQSSGPKQVDKELQQQQTQLEQAGPPLHTTLKTQPGFTDLYDLD